MTKGNERARPWRERGDSSIRQVRNSSNLKGQLVREKTLIKDQRKSISLLTLCKLLLDSKDSSTGRDKDLTLELVIAYKEATNKSTAYQASFCIETPVKAPAPQLRESSHSTPFLPKERVPWTEHFFWRWVMCRPPLPAQSATAELAASLPAGIITDLSVPT